MSTRHPIQVPKELKNRIEAAKGRFYARTNYEVIEYLLRDHEAHNKFRQDQIQRWEDEKKRQDREMIQAGVEVKKEFVRVQTEFGVSEESEFLRLLLLHWEKSESFSRDVLYLMKEMKR